jgi:hypothetical protein
MVSCTTDDNRTCSSCSCTSGDGPCKSLLSIQNRWGTDSITVPQPIVISLLSSEPNTYSDVISWSPSCAATTVSDGGTSINSIQIIGTPTVVASGALVSGSNLVRTTQTLTNASFSSIAPDAASLSVGYQLRDTTTSPASATWIEGNISGDTWSLLTPLRAFDTIPLNLGAPQWGAEYAEVAIGATDTVTVQTFPGINVASITPKAATYSRASCVELLNVTASNGTAGSANKIILGGGVLVADSAIHGDVTVVPGPVIAATNSGFGVGWGYQTIFYNVDAWSYSNENIPYDVLGQEAFADRTGGSILIQGGAVGIDTNQTQESDHGCRLGSVDIQQDFVIGQNLGDGFITIGRGRAGSVAFFTSNTQRVIFTDNFAFGVDIIAPAGGQSGLQWGPGNWYVQNNASVTYTQAPGNVFLGSGTLTVDGQTTMCSVFPTDGGQAFTYCNIPITPANLEAGAGDSGFANNAFIPGGAHIWQTSSE